MSKQINDAEKVLSELQSKRARLIARGVEIGDQRAAIAYDAHATGDTKAEKRLAELHREAAEYESQLAGLDSAIKTAGEKLAQARQAEVARADREAAAALRRELDRFREYGRQLDAALATVATSGQALHESLGKIHSLGSAFPTGQQLHSLGARALLTAIAATPWRREFETIAPRERRSFSDLIETWAATIESRLGEKTDEEKAA
jgi:chromosome segregation ATPase